jgi:hypothetical protein
MTKDRRSSGAKSRIEYRVLERPSYEVIAICDRLNEAREAVRILESYDIRQGIYEPLTYEIQAVIYEEAKA